MRRRIRASDLDAATRAILDAFADRRLIVRDRDDYDVAHEALFRAWPPLVETIERERPGCGSRPISSP